MISLSRVRPPIAVPNTCQRMALLCKSSDASSQAGQKAKNNGGSQSHLTSQNNYGIITLVRSTFSSWPTNSTGAKLLSWQTYSKSSWPPFHRIWNVFDQVDVYAPGSSTVTSYFNVSKSVRVNFSMK